MSAEPATQAGAAVPPPDPAPPLVRLARELTEQVGADACAISGVIGDLLLMVAEHAGSGGTLQLGHGYLISDFPTTAHALATGEPTPVAVTGADEAEARVLRELGMTHVLMLALQRDGSSWGLAELYRRDDRAFAADDTARAQAIVAAFSATR